MPTLVLGAGVAEMKMIGTWGVGDWSRDTSGPPLNLGLGVRCPADKRLSHLASRAGAIRPPNYEIIEVLR